MFKTIAVGVLLVLWAAAGPPARAQGAAFPVTVTVDAGQTLAPVNPVWRFFGADEPNYATMKDGRTTLATLGGLAPGQVYFRAHNLLTTGDGTPALKWGSTNAYTEDAQHRPVYDWAIVDRIFDTYLARGVKPYVEIGFMPEALSIRPEPYQHDWRPGSGQIQAGWAYPPKDEARWEELVYQWVSHCVARYGRAEVATWYFETWNEANLTSYWVGSPDAFYQLHDAAVRGVRRALPQARVGGPDFAGTRDPTLAAFMAHVDAVGDPDDFVSFHAKGKAEFVEGGGGAGHVRLGISTHLQVADYDFAAIAADPAFAKKPIIIGESDPEGCAACRGPANAYRNGTMYSSYTAAVIPRLQALARRRGVSLEGVLTWAFEYEDQPYFAGFRQLTSAGIDLPVMNLFKLLAKMSGQSVAAVSDHQASLDAILKDGVRGDPDVGAVAALDGQRLTVLVWHYHDDDVAGPDADVRLVLKRLPPAFAKGVSLTHYRVDGAHSNAYAAWLAMGSPIAPSDSQRAGLLKAAQLATLDDGPSTVAEVDGDAELRFTLPRQGVSLLVLTAK